jgi:hypothetical protein
MNPPMTRLANLEKRQLQRIETFNSLRLLSYSAAQAFPADNVLENRVVSARIGNHLPQLRVLELLSRRIYFVLQ